MFISEPDRGARAAPGRRAARSSCATGGRSRASTRRCWSCRIRRADRPRQYLKIAPSRARSRRQPRPQERKRGLFHATVYDAKVDMTGRFVIPPEAQLRDFVTDKDGRFLWNEAFIAFGTTSSLTGLRNVRQHRRSTAWRRHGSRASRRCATRRPAMARACWRMRRWSRSTRKRGSTFKSTVTLRGTSSFSVVYGGKELDAKVRSPWPSPSFTGNMLPVNSTVTADGFDAHWEIDRVRLAARLVVGDHHRSGDLERAGGRAST